MRSFFADMILKKEGLLSKLNFLDDESPNICFPLHDRHTLNNKPKDDFFSILRYEKRFFDSREIKLKKVIFQFANAEDDNEQTDKNRIMDKAGNGFMQVDHMPAIPPLPQSTRAADHTDNVLALPLDNNDQVSDNQRSVQGSENPISGSISVGTIQGAAIYKTKLERDSQLKLEETKKAEDLEKKVMAVLNTLDMKPGFKDRKLELLKIFMRKDPLLKNMENLRNGEQTEAKSKRLKIMKRNMTNWASELRSIMKEEAEVENAIQDLEIQKKTKKKSPGKTDSEKSELNQLRVEKSNDPVPDFSSLGDIPEISSAVKFYASNMDHYQVTSNFDLYKTTMKALNSNQPIRNILPKVLKYGLVANLRTDHELGIKCPVDEAMKVTFWKNLENYPESTMRQYFGEKIALYFAFLAFYRDKLVYPSIYGALLTVLLFVYRGLDDGSHVVTPEFSLDWWLEKVYEWGTVVFCAFIVVWMKYFKVTWQRYEIEFSIKYGQSTDEDRTRQIRPSFMGIQARSVTSEKVNSPQEDSRRTTKWQRLSIIFLLIYSILTAYVAYVILDSKRKAYVNNSFESFSKTEGSFFVELTGLLFNSVEFLRIKLFELVFFSVISWMIVKQNLKYVDQHEAQLIIYSGLYQLFNNSVVIVIIGLQSLINAEQDEDGSFYSNVCAKGSCTEELNYFFMIYCLFQLIWATVYKLAFLPLLDKIRSGAKFVLNKVKRGVSKAFNKIKKIAANDKDKHRHSSPSAGDRGTPGRDRDSKPGEKLEEAQKKRLLKLIKSEEEKIRDVTFLHYRYPFYYYNKINEEIDLQIRKLEDYKIGDDFDQTLMDYLELFNMVSFVALFGALFPVSFFIVFAIAFIEWYIDSRFLLKQTKRPNPTSTRTIGLWLSLIRLVCFLSAITNSFFISFVLFEQKSYLWNFTCFLITSMVFLILGAIITHTMSGPTSDLIILHDRIEFVRDKLFRKSKPNIERYEYHEMKVTTSKLFGGIDLQADKKRVLATMYADLVEDADHAQAKIESDMRSIKIGKLRTGPFNEKAAREDRLTPTVPNLDMPKNQIVDSQALSLMPSPVQIDNVELRAPTFGME